MINFSNEKIHNAYLIETYNYESIKSNIIDFAEKFGFDQKLIEAGTHPDIFFIESEDKTISVDTIRNDVIDKIYFTPKIAERKFYIIYDAANIKEESQNAMLKTLEEPPDFVSIFLVTKNISKLLDTIKSRCQIIKDTEDVNYEKILTLSYIDDAFKIIGNLKYDSPGDKMKFVDEVLDEDTNLNNFIKLFRLIIRDSLIYKTTLSKNHLLLKGKEELISSIAYTYSLEEFGKLADKLDDLSYACNQYNVNKKIAAFNFLEV